MDSIHGLTRVVFQLIIPTEMWGFLFHKKEKNENKRKRKYILFFATQKMHTTRKKNNIYHINYGPYYKGGKSFSLKESRLYLMYVNRYFTYGDNYIILAFKRL